MKHKSMTALAIVALSGSMALSAIAADETKPETATEANAHATPEGKVRKPPLTAEDIAKMEADTGLTAEQLAKADALAAQLVQKRAEIKADAALSDEEKRPRPESPSKRSKATSRR